MRTHSQLAFILHKRAFRDTSQILEVFTRDHGRLSLMSRGSRNPKSRQNALLQLHRPLLLGWSGRGEMPALSSVEAAEFKAPELTGHSLFSALYVDELISYLLHRHDVNVPLFQLYQDTLYALQQTEIEPVLRLFEKRLLDCLGFSMQLDTDAGTGEPVSPEASYQYLPESGPVRIHDKASGSGAMIISGRCLLAYAHNRLDDPEVLSSIKLLNRQVLSHHLCGRPLRSRDLFRRTVSAADQS